MILLTTLFQRSSNILSAFSFAQSKPFLAVSFTLSHHPSDKYILSSPNSSHASERIHLNVDVGSYSSATIARNESAPLPCADFNPTDQDTLEAYS